MTELETILSTKEACGLLGRVRVLSCEVRDVLYKCDAGMYDKNAV